MATIGRSFVIKGELSGDEDLVVESRVEGNIDFHQNLVTVGEQGKVQARIVARKVIVAGEVRGDIGVAEKVDVRAGGSVEGDITTSRIAIALGAYFRGSIDLEPSSCVKPAAETTVGTDANLPGKPRVAAN